MTVWVMRHAHAVAEAADRPDPERHLSTAGRHGARHSAAWLVEQPYAPRAIITSPIARAVQTAEIIAAALDLDRVEVFGPLATPGGSAKVVADWLKHEDGVLAIGHEPNISGVVAYLIGDAGFPVLAPAQIVVVQAGRVVAESPALTSPAAAPPSTPASPAPR